MYVFFLNLRLTVSPSVNEVSQGLFNLGAADAALSKSGLKLTENFQAYF